MNGVGAFCVIAQQTKILVAPADLGNLVGRGAPFSGICPLPTQRVPLCTILRYPLSKFSTKSKFENPPPRENPISASALLPYILYPTTDYKMVRNLFLWFCLRIVFFGIA